MKPSSPARPFAKRSLGQNFLVDRSYVNRIVSCLGLADSDVVLEIGPGRGALTSLLAEKAGRVIGVEIDRDLVPALREEFAELPSVEIVEADFLQADLAGFVGSGRVKVVANLPYYISTAILRRLFDYRHHFTEIVVMLQKEVAERIAAPAGSSERGYLTVFIERGFRCEKLFDVPPGAFRPVPQVESSVVRLTPLNHPAEESGEALFAELISAGFAQKRKTLANNLKNAGGDLKKRVEELGGPSGLLEAAGVKPKSRAEDLTREEWEVLLGLLCKK